MDTIGAAMEESFTLTCADNFEKVNWARKKNKTTFFILILLLNNDTGMMPFFYFPLKQKQDVIISVKMSANIRFSNIYISQKISPEFIYFPYIRILNKT